MQRNGNNMKKMLEKKIKKVVLFERKRKGVSKVKVIMMYSVPNMVNKINIRTFRYAYIYIYIYIY